MTDAAMPDEAEGTEDPLGPPADASADASAEASADPAPADADAPASEDGTDATDAPAASVEELIADLERTTAERDEYLDALRRNQADFENYRKRVAKQLVDDAERASGSLVEQLLPVLDACDAAVLHGATEVDPILAALLGNLEKQGLERIDPAGQEFDPNLHEAVMHEPADDAQEGTLVSAVMRPGYAWKGRVLRAAMVKVKG